MKTICVFIILCCLFACRQTTKVRIEPKETDTISNIPIAEQSCYAYIKGKDTAELTLITTGVALTGELAYKWFEKDKNMGTIEGEMRGDTLVATYTFDSEGQKSTRQVAFLRKGNQFLEGFGEVKEKDGKTQFKDLSKLDFSQPIIFEKVACKVK